MAQLLFLFHRRKVNAVNLEIIGALSELMQAAIEVKLVLVVDVVLHVLHIGRESLVPEFNSLEKYVAFQLAVRLLLVFPLHVYKANIIGR